MTSRRHLNLTAYAVGQLRRNWALSLSPPLLWQSFAAGPAYSAFERIQNVAVGRRIDDCALAPGPIVILGYWRSGTTLLHEYLCCDSRYGYPTTYACFNPQHFVLTEGARRAAGSAAVRRPMDEMVIDAASPQEDEFAQLCLGARSPYEAIFVPERLEEALALADPNVLDAAERAHWCATFLRFLRGVTLQQGGRPLVLKSPAHGSRIELLQQLLPDARFVLVVRDPRLVFASTVRMWRSMFSLYAFGPVPPDDDICRAVLTDRPRYEARLADGLRCLAPDRFFSLRYEDLVVDPVAVIGNLYQRLELGDFAAVRDGVSAEAKRRSVYRARAELPDDVWSVAISERWQDILRIYGYA